MTKFGAYLIEDDVYQRVQGKIEEFRDRVRQTMDIDEERDIGMEEPEGKLKLLHMVSGTRNGSFVTSTEEMMAVQTTRWQKDPDHVAEQ